MDKSIQAAIAYHEATKHHFNRYARSLGYLDWANQPDPFRRYAGAPTISLPLIKTDATQPYDKLYEPDAIPAQPVNLESIALLFECSLAISAWKEYQGNRWALRCNPSSGNLHPTEGYLIAGPIAGVSDSPAVYHYAPHEHALEQRTAFDAATWQQLISDFPANTFLVGLSSIHWREAWKYGERAYRYCQHDAGHALAAIRIAAAMLGWRATHLDGMSDLEVGRLLGIDASHDFPEGDEESPDLILAIHTVNASLPCSLPVDVIDAIAKGDWIGRPNPLSEDHVDWEIIDRVSKACAKPATDTSPVRALIPRACPPLRRACAATAYRIVQQRRSAVEMDGRTGISRDAFYTMMRRVTPALCSMPWDALPPPVCVHLGIFVHRVEGIPPGLYALVRHPAAEPALRESMKPDFSWERPPGCPADLPLYIVEVCDCVRAAALVSCQQDIAGDGAFSLGMLAEFEPRLSKQGSWFYRRLFWETGMIGQVLYLEAEAAGVRATGIGCFFDDPVHDLFGLKDRTFQSLYHFTVGGPLEDHRLTTLPPYGHRTA